MQPGETAKGLLLEMAGLYKADVMVVGFHGRKGVKADVTIMGSAVQYLG